MKILKGKRWCTRYILVSTFPLNTQHINEISNYTALHSKLFSKKPNLGLSSTQHAKSQKTRKEKFTIRQINAQDSRMERKRKYEISLIEVLKEITFVEHNSTPMN